jgi:hypothetical protein
VRRRWSRLCQYNDRQRWWRLTAPSLPRSSFLPSRCADLTSRARSEQIPNLLSRQAILSVSCCRTRPAVSSCAWAPHHHAPVDYRSAQPLPIIICDDTDWYRSCLSLSMMADRAPKHTREGRGRVGRAKTQDPEERSDGSHNY